MNAIDALNKARRAWEATQPQYVIPGVLEQADGVGSHRPSARARPLPPSSPTVGGLTAGAEPRRVNLSGLTAHHPDTAAAARPGASAPQTHEGDGREHFPVTSARPQTGA